MKKSTKVKKTIFNIKTMYKILGYLTLKIINHIKKAIKNILIDYLTLALNTIKLLLLFIQVLRLYAALRL